MKEEFVPKTAERYNDEDLVYVDPKTRVVMGFVEWSNAGKPKPLPVKEHIEEDDDEAAPAPAAEKGSEAPAKPAKGGRPVRVRRTRYCPWGTYRSMKRVYKIEGKVRDNKDENRKTLDEAIELAMKEPFWD
jgi:hypothetical protein